MANEEEQQLTIVDAFLRNPKAKEIIQEFQEKKIDVDTSLEVKKFLDHQYFTVVEDFSEELLANRLEIYKNFMFFRTKFADFASKELLEMKDEEYEMFQNEKTVLLTIHEGIRIVERLAESDKKTSLKMLMLIQLQKEAIDRLVEFIAMGGIKRKVGIRYKRGIDAYNIAMQEWEGEWVRRKGKRPISTIVAERYNVRAGGREDPMGSKDIGRYAKAGYQKAVEDGRMTIEEVKQRGFTIEDDSEPDKTEDSASDKTEDAFADDSSDNNPVSGKTESDVKHGKSEDIGGKS